MDTVTKNVGKYIKSKGVAISKISSETGIKQGVLYPCFSGRRSLRADEFLAVCAFLGVNPKSFSEPTAERAS